MDNDLWGITVLLIIGLVIVCVAGFVEWRENRRREKNAKSSHAHIPEWWER